MHTELFEEASWEKVAWDRQGFGRTTLRFIFIM